MNGMALLLAKRGLRIRGTDPGLTPRIRETLDKAGIETSEKQDGTFLTPNTQLLIVTAAVPENHLELKTAKSLGVPVVKYARALGALIASMTGIAVAGTHGKTTTSGMIVSALNGAGLDPSYLIGASLQNLERSAHSGTSPIFVAEACEYDYSFLNLSPKIAVITNVEADHLDTFGDLDGVFSAFEAFVSRIVDGGTLVYNTDCKGAKRVAKSATCRKVSYSVKTKADFEAMDIKTEGAKTNFDLAISGKKVVSIDLQPPGIHNVSNCLAALAVGRELSCNTDSLSTGISEFRGMTRRFEKIGEYGDIAFIDDYAHHPTELKSLIGAAASRYAGRRLVIAFQPHQLSRTKYLFDDFSKSFIGAHVVLICDVFAARDDNVSESGFLSSRLATAIQKTGIETRYIPRLQDLAKEAILSLKPGDVFITAGAGDIYKVGHSIIKQLKNQ